MKIIVFGATGNVGSRIVQEAADRGHEVTAVVRQRQKAELLGPSVEMLVRDVTTANDLEEKIVEHDIAVTALRAPNGQEASLVPLTQTVVETARRANVRFIVVGGAAPLLVPGTPGHTVLTAPGFLPENIVPTATASQNQYEWCIDRLHPNGAYLCPPANLTPGDRTGTYRLGTDSLVVDGSGESRISMEDFAVAMLDEAETPKHMGRSFTVGY